MLCRTKTVELKDGKYTVHESNYVRRISDTERGLRTSGYVYIGEQKWALTDNGKIIIVEVIPI